MKFISSSYNKESGMATVIMQHLGIKFVGTAKVHPEEKDKASEYAGCYYAEIRATIKALKHEKEILEKEYETAKEFVKSCENYKNFDKSSSSARAMYRQLNRRLLALNKVKQAIDDNTKELKYSISHRANLLNAMQKKHEAKAIFEKALEEKRAKKDN